MENSEIILENAKQLIQFCLKRENTIMRSHNMDEYKQVCMRTFTDIHQKYPTLFFKIVEEPSSFPLYRLEEMLNMKKKIENNESSEEEESKKLGQQYYDEFVKDRLPTRK